MDQTIGVITFSIFSLLWIDGKVTVMAIQLQENASKNATEFTVHKTETFHSLLPLFIKVSFPKRDFGVVFGGTFFNGIAPHASRITYNLHVDTFTTTLTTSTPT